MSNLDGLMAILMECAREGKPCPTNNALAEALDIATAGTVVKVIDRAERCGLIEVERYQKGRIVTICGTELKTGAVAQIPHWRNRAGIKRTSPGKRDRGPLAEEPYHEFVSRDPCPWCGVRPEFGCRHSPKPEMTL